MIRVLAIVTTAAGRREDFLKEFHRVMPLVHAEAGCIEYGPTIDLDIGIPGLPAPRPDIVSIIEKWDNVESLKAHLVAPHMRTYRAVVKELVLNTEIHVLEPV